MLDLWELMTTKLLSFITQHWAIGVMEASFWIRYGCWRYARVLNVLKLDILLDWSGKTVTIYVNGTNKGTANFYHTDVDVVDTVMLYNLNPNTIGYFKDIEVCEGKCAGRYDSLLLSSNMFYLGFTSAFRATTSIFLIFTIVMFMFLL